MKWRTLEWWGCGLALFLQTGAVFPLLMSLSSGGLDGSAMSKLRVVALPAYAISLFLLYRHRRQLLAVARRNLTTTGMILLPFLSVAWSISPSVSLRRAIALALSMALAYLLAVRFTPAQLMRLVAWVLVPCMVASLLVGIGAPHIGRSPEGELRGIFTHKNVLGWFSFFAVIASLAVMRESPRLRSRALGAAMLAVSVVALVMSTSMTAMVSVVTGLLLFPIYLTIARLKGLARVLFIVVVVQTAVVLGLVMAQYTVPVLEALGRDATLTGRVPLWQLVDQAISHRPALGYGYKAFWTAASQDMWTIWYQLAWQPPHAHNGYREVLLSLGLVGFGLLVLLVARGLYQGCALLCREPQAGWLWLNVIVGVFLVLNITECLLFEQNSFFSILFVTVLLMFGARFRETTPSQSSWTAARFGSPGDPFSPVVPSPGRIAPRG